MAAMSARWSTVSPYGRVRPFGLSRPAGDTALRSLGDRGYGRGVRYCALATAVLLGCSSSPPAPVDAGEDASHESGTHVDAAHHDATHDAASRDASPESGSSRTLSFGPGLQATLTTAGQLTITRAGSTLLATPPGQPVLSSAADPANPVGWHDPKSLASDTFSPVADSAITWDSPAPGTLHFAATDTRADVVLVSLALASDAGFYTGLGERYDHVDPRGEIVGMQLEIDAAYESSTTDRHVPVPWIVSSNGYGVFVKDRQAGAWDVASTDPTVLRSTFEGSSLDVTLVVDPDPLAVVAKLTQLTGLQRATPVWALAPMMWRHVDDQAELMTDLMHIRSLHIPTTTFWIDDGWQVALNTLDFDTIKYTSAASLTASMQSLGYKLFGWNSPYLQAPVSGTSPNEAQALYPTAAASGYFVKEGNVPFAAPGPGSGSYGLLDFTSAAATASWDGRAESPVLLGMDGFKLDYGEDMVPDLFGQRLGLTLADGETERTARNYPLAYHGAYRQALAAGSNDGGASDAATSDGGVLVVRASTYGGAQVADIIWPGDLDNGFQHYGDMGTSALLVGGLPSSIVAAQTLAASGFALYGADTGGYRMGAPTKESLLRWAEHTSLSMVMQLGPGESKYPWNYDADTVTTYAALANLHQSLIPYLASLLAAAQKDGTPTIRPLPLAYPTDTVAPTFADDEYLLGPSLLVAPVVTEGATSRQVHLPPGMWFSWWGGAAVSGPATQTVQAPIGQPPLYVLAGSLLPLLPPGIDTLVASNDPSTVSLAALAGQDAAAAWVRGAASATCLDGSVVSVTDDAQGVLVTWSPAGTGNTMTMTLDLSQRTGTTSALTTVSQTFGTSLTDETSAANVLSAPAGAGAVYLSGDQVTLRMVGPTMVRFTL
jgi:alpha-glucosidase (family GH31 glycosyl hydrolase)